MLWQCRCPVGEGWGGALIPQAQAVPDGLV